MNEIQKKTNSLPGVALASIILGILSVLLIILGIIVGLIVNSIGITSFITPTILLGTGAVICGIMSKNVISAENKANLRIARIGIIAGAVAISVAIITRVMVFVAFIPWLFAG